MFKIPLIKNTFYNETETRAKLSEFIKTQKQLSMGEKCLEFEEKFSKWQGRKYSTLFNSGSSANLALIQSLKNLGVIKTGDKISVSALTWATNVMPIIQLGMIPIPSEVFEQNNQFKNCGYAEEKIIFQTNILGGFENHCDEGKILIEDNCESLGSIRSGTKSGNLGLAATFSFYVAHQLSTIEGGMVSTDWKPLSEMLKMVRSHGWIRNIGTDTAKDYEIFYGTKQRMSKFTFYDLGYNLRPTEITGYLGCEQIKYIDETTKKRNEIYYQIFDKKDDYELYSAFSIPIRKEKLKLCMELGIETRPIIAGNITKQPFWKKYIKSDYNFPETDYIENNYIYCGCYPEMTDEEIDLIRSVV